MTEDEIIQYIAERIRAHRRNTYLDLLDRSETAEVDLTLAANIVSYVRGHSPERNDDRDTSMTYDDFVLRRAKLPPGRYTVTGAIWHPINNTITRADPETVMVVTVSVGST